MEWPGLTLLGLERMAWSAWQERSGTDRKGRAGRGVGLERWGRRGVASRGTVGWGNERFGEARQVWRERES